MTDPTTSAAAAGIAASISGVTLALIGVEWYALLWSFVGALLAMGEAASMGRLRAIVYVALTTLVGAALGHGLVAVLDLHSRAILILFSLAGGAGAQRIVSAAIKAVETRLGKLGEGSK